MSWTLSQLRNTKKVHEHKQQCKVKPSHKETRSFDSQASPNSKCLSIDPSLKKQEHKFLQLGIFILKNKTKKKVKVVDHFKATFDPNHWPTGIKVWDYSSQLLSLTCSSLSAYQFLIIIIIIIISNLIWPISHN